MNDVVRGVAYLLLSFLAAVLLAGCGLDMFSFVSREPWRAEAERVCLAQYDTRTPYIQKVSVKGKGICGMERPLKASAFAGGSVRVGPGATLGCPMIAAVDRWLTETVQPAAYERFGMPVVEIKNISSYSCRTRNNVRGAKLSEHAFGNGLDIAAFTLANGRVITVEHGWKGQPDERAFLRHSQGGACDVFGTVLAPGSDRHHYNHFHLDLARHGGSESHYCRPQPQMPAPAAPRWNGVPMVQAPAWPGAQPNVASGPATPVYSPQAAYPNAGYAAPVDGRSPYLLRRPSPPVGVPLGYAPAN